MKRTTGRIGFYMSALAKWRRAILCLLLCLVAFGGCAPAAGSKSPDWPHVIASGEDTWFPAPGYTWTNRDRSGKPIPGDFAVHWNPGSQYWFLGKIKNPNIFAGEEEGIWFPAPGYTWTNLDKNGKPIPGDFAVHWIPGIAYWHLGYNEYPHVFAQPQEGRWRVAEGYEWLNEDRGDLRAVPAGERRKREAMKKHWMNYLKEIQDQGAYQNWSGPPYDLYMRDQK